MFLKNFDLISEINSIYYKGNKQHVSKIGGFLTILVYLTSAFFAVYFSIDTIYKKNPTSYFFKKFSPDVGFLYLNSTMFHFIQLLDPDDNVVMDENSWMIFGTETYIDEFLNDFNITKESHWNYGLCNENDDFEFKSINEDRQYLKSWCVKGYWDSEIGKYYRQTDIGYIPPYVAHGTGCKTEKNIGYGVYVAKCQNTPFRTNCKSLNEINEEFKKLLRIKVSVIDNNFDVTMYSNPVVPYFLDIKNHLTGETITHNNLNFNPVFIQTNDGLVFNTNKTEISYRLDFNEKLTYERGNTSLLSGWYFLITNLGETYTRTYPKFQEAIANVGGTLKAILLLAQVLNFLFNQWTIILDIQLECEKLDLDYSFFGKENVIKKNIELNLKNQVLFSTVIKKDNNYNNIINKSSSKIPLRSNSSSNMNKLYQLTKLKKINNYIDRKNDINNFNKNNKFADKNNIINRLDTIDNAQNKSFSKIKKSNKKIKKHQISFCFFFKTIFKEKVKDNENNIRLTHKFWINEISEENIVQMDLKLYKLSNRFLNRNSMHINNFIEESKDLEHKESKIK